MAISKKQLDANRRNAKKGGVKTAAGKEIVRYNALKHGLFAREAVITKGEGAEDRVAFERLLKGLIDYFQPVGTLEELLTEKLAVGFWRTRRLYRFEAGLIRRELDRVTDDFYNQQNPEGEEIYIREKELEATIECFKEEIKMWPEEGEYISRMHREGRPLAETYEQEESWSVLSYQVKSPLMRLGINALFLDPPALQKVLMNRLGWTEDQIWERLLNIWQRELQDCRERLPEVIKEWKKEKEINRQKIEVKKKLGCIPPKEDLERLNRYEATIEREFYRTLKELERLQRLRLGERAVPLRVDAEVLPHKEDKIKD